MIRQNLAAMALCLAALSSGCVGSERTDSTSDVSAGLLAQSIDPDPPAQAGDAAVPDGGEALVPPSVVGFNRGSEQAPVKVVEMSDFGCGYCRQFHQETFPTLLAEFVETGMVEWKFVPYITGMFENSLVATEAVECTHAQDPEAFELLSRRVWAEQGAWKGSDEPAPILRAWTAELDVDMAEFDACLAADDRMPRIAASTTLARQIGVRGTPTFVIIGYPPLQGALPLETFREILTMVHAESQGAGAEGGRP